MELFNKYWKNTTSKTATDHFVRCALKAIYAKNQNKRLEIFEGLLSKTFSPITNKNKLNNGMSEYDAIKAAIHKFSWLSKHTYADIISKEDYIQILELSKNIRFKYLNRKYIIVYVNNSLTPIQKVVQSSHGTHQLGLKESSYKQEPHFWVFGFDNEKEVLTKLKKHNIKFSIWKEEDLNDMTTSIVTFPIPLYKKRFFENEAFLTI